MENYVNELKELLNRIKIDRNKNTSGYITAVTNRFKQDICIELLETIIKIVERG